MIRLVTLLALTLGAATLGCGESGATASDGGADAIPAADSAQPDGEAPCTRTGFTAAGQTAEAAPSHLYYGAATAETAPYDFLSLELYYGLGGAEPLKGSGTLVIGANADDLDYATCSTCVLAYAECDDTGACARSFMATGGVLAVTGLANGGRFAGSLTGLRLVEVTIDPVSYSTSPVAGGDTWCVSTYAFDAEIVGVLPCSGNADCAATADAPYCQLDSGACVGCLEESHCASFGQTPHCDAAAGQCVECVADTDCSANAAGSFCDAGLCGACGSAFDCASSASPACVANGTSGRAECIAPAACAGDDGFANQGPAAARSVATTTPASGAICDAADQADWFVFQNAATGNVTLTLAWTITNAGNAEDLDLVVYDASGAVLGESYVGTEREDVTLTFLGAGEVYARVTAYTMGAAVSAVPYTLSVTRSAATCSADADCAAAYAHQRLRGSCSGGACVPITGNGARAAGAACDSPDDCASGLCTYGGYDTDGLTYGVDYHYLKDADSRAYCVASRCDVTHPCGGSRVCSLGFCLPPCTDSAQCPVITGGGDVVPIDGWAHATCDIATGECRY
jgi:hypothetical protein